MATNNAINLSRCTFSAQLSTTTGGVTGNGTPYFIICDTELVDEAGAYDNLTGIYTVPVTGNYLLNATVVLSNITVAAVISSAPILVIAGNPSMAITLNLGNCATLAGVASFSISVILPLAASTAVRLEAYVQGEAGDTVAIGGLSGSFYTFFSGTLLL